MPVMSAGKQREQDLLDHFFLADDDLGEFGFDVRPPGDQFLHRLRVCLMGFRFCFHNAFRFLVCCRFNESSSKK